MQITVHRAAKNRIGVFWRPVEHTYQQREAMQVVRRDRGAELPPRLAWNRYAVDLSELDMLLAGASRAYTDARIESPYKRGVFVEGFVYVQGLAAFVHKANMEEAEKAGSRIGAGAIIGRGVRLGLGASVGSFTELEAGVCLGTDAQVGDNAVIRKGSIVSARATIAGQTYVGQRSRIGVDATIGPMTNIGRGSIVCRGASLGMQDMLGNESYVGSSASVDDTVRAGKAVQIGHHAIIGEQVVLGSNNHIGARSIIGAESRFADFVRVAPDVMLVSPTYAEEGAFIKESNFVLQLPSSFEG